MASGERDESDGVARDQWEFDRSTAPIKSTPSPNPAPPTPSPSSAGGPPSRQPQLKPDPSLPDPLQHAMPNRPVAQSLPAEQRPAEQRPAQQPPGVQRHPVEPQPSMQPQRRQANASPSVEPSARPVEPSQRQPNQRQTSQGPPIQGQANPVPRYQVPTHQQAPRQAQPQQVQRSAAPARQRSSLSSAGSRSAQKPPTTERPRRPVAVGGRNTQGDLREIQKQKAREAKWAGNRWAVPYRTDGPKVTLGVTWFVALVGAAMLGFNFDNAAVSSVAVAVVTASIAGLAGMQIGYAWFPRNTATRTWTACAAFTTGVAGFYGPWGVVIGLVFGLLILTVYLVLYRGHRRPAAQLYDVLVRAAIPVGLASASLAAMAFRNLPVLIALILFVSAYEIGDFLVGSGAFNPFEGPMAGLIAAGVVAFFLFLIEPDPFSSETIVVFIAIAAVCCPAGQYLASALLPRGNAWAPALRRIDSYLLVAPLWLLLLVLLPDLH